MKVNYLTKVSIFSTVISSSLLMTGCQTLGHQSSTQYKQPISTLFFSSSHLTNQLTGKMIFIYMTGYGENRQAQLIETGFDNLKPKTIYSVNGTIMSLSASPIDKRLIFTVQEGKGYPKVIVLDRKTQKITNVSPERTNNFSGSISPDGKQLLLANSQTGNPEIFLTDSLGQNQQQLTRQTAIDVAPVWFPDGKSFIFTSDKKQFLHPQLYRYYLNTHQSDVLTKYGKSNAIAKVSPLGNLITYVANNADGMLMDLDGESKILINNEGLAEAANFSPDGNYLIFSATNSIKILPVPKVQNGKFEPINTLASININTTQSQKFTIREPIWVKD